MNPHIQALSNVLASLDAQLSRAGISMEMANEDFRAHHAALTAAIALMRGQSEVAAWQVRVFYPREQKWSKWQDISQDSYEAAKREGCYHEYTTIELRELVPAQNDPADEQ
jgi:hypothetical protein